MSRTLYELSTKRVPGAVCKPIAKIVPFKNMKEYASYLDLPPKKRHKFADRYIYVVTHDKPIYNPRLSIDESDYGFGTIVPIMVEQDDGYPNRVFIAGGTLCGKSLMASVLCNDYNSQHKKNNIIVVSSVDDTRNYNDVRVKRLVCMKVDDSLLDDPIDLERLKKSCTVFDDIEAHEDKDVVRELENMRDRCIRTGRHYDTACIVSNQTLLGSDKTKQALSNCFQVIAYPSSAGKYQLTQFLTRYMSFNKDQIQRIMNLPSRYVLINRTMPNYILSENEVFMP